jgi:DNA-binding transcriptional MocR family regulator
VTQKTDALNRGQRWRIFNRFVDASFPQLGETARNVWLVLFRHADKGGQTFVSQATVARTMRAHVSTVKRAYAELRRLGLLITLRPGKAKQYPALLRVRCMAVPGWEVLPKKPARPRQAPKPAANDEGPEPEEPLRCEPWDEPEPDDW